jgi:hypothetical protein
VLQKELVTQLLWSAEPETRSYEEIREAVVEAWQGWLSHRRTRWAGIYFGAFAEEIWALAAVAHREAPLRSYLTAGLLSAVRHRDLAGEGLTEIQTQALSEAVDLLGRNDLNEAMLAACEERMEAAGLRLSPGLNGDALREFVELCADEE